MLNRRFAILVAICFMLSGCGTIRSEMVLGRASKDMSKSDVVNKIGPPAMVRGTFINDDGKCVEVWEYKIGRGKYFEQVLGEAIYAGLTAGSGGQVLLTSADTDRCWVYFIKDRFAGWTPAGDWARDTDKMHQMRFNTRS